MINASSSKPATPASKPRSRDKKKLLAPRISKLEHLPAKSPTRAKVLAIQRGDIKPDVHLREDLIKPQTSYSCTSLNHSGYAPSFGDDVRSSRNVFQVTDMVDVGRPERDHSLRIPMMIYKTKLRKYKSGVRDSVKQQLLMERIGDAAREMIRGKEESGADEIFVENMPRGEKVTEHLSIDDSMVTDEKLSSHAEISKSANFSGSEKNIVVRSASKLHLFQLTNESLNHGVHKGVIRKGALSELSHASSLPSTNLYQPTSAAVTKDGVEVTTRGSMPNSPLIFDDSAKGFSAEPLSPPGSAFHSHSTSVSNKSIKPQPIYSPATFRLPNTAPVPGFGDNPDHVQEKLGAYWVHSNKAVAAAAALEISSEVSLTTSQREGGDTFRASEAERFLQRGLEQAANSLDLKTLNTTEEKTAEDCDDKSVSTVNVSISRRSEDYDAAEEKEVYEKKIVTYAKYEGPDPSIVMDMEQGQDSVTESVAPKGRDQQKLTCSQCLQRSGTLWCQECQAAFCGTCWVKVAHHELKYMLFEEPPMNNEPSIRITKQTSGYTRDQSRGSRSRSPERPISRSHRARSGSPTNRNTYSRSILFTGYYPGEGADRKSIPKEKKYDSKAPAMIPLPDKVVLRYDDYPQCVVVDGKGNVISIDPYSENAHMRPYTSPATPNGQQNILHFQNDQKLQRILNGGRTPDSSVAAGGGTNAVRVRTSGGYNGGPPESNPTLGPHSKTQYSGRYRGALMPGSTSSIAMQHRLGKVTVRRGQRKRPGSRQHIPSFSAGVGGNTNFAYSSKPSTAATPRPTSRNPNSPPQADDWLEDLFKYDDPISEEPYNDDQDPFKRRQPNPNRKTPNTPKNNPLPEKNIGYYDDKMVYVKPLRAGSGKFSRAGSQKLMNAAIMNGKFSPPPVRSAGATL